MAVPPSTRRVVRERAQRHGEDCHADERWPFVRFPIAPVRPQSAGGAEHADNVAFACRHGHARRGNRGEGRAPETETVVSRVNPRRERWGDHCVWAAARRRIIGRTPTGRATVMRLDRNDDRHEGRVVHIRPREVAEGYHPPREDPVRSA